MRPVTAREPTQSTADSVRGPAHAVGCCAHGFRFAKHLCPLEGDAHWLAPVTSITDRSNGYMACVLGSI